MRVPDDRETVLKEIMDEKECSRGEAKKNVLSLMFKDPTREWRGLSTFEKSFESEMKENAEKLLNGEKNKGVDWVDKDCLI